MPAVNSTSAAPRPVEEIFLSVEGTRVYGQFHPVKRAKKAVVLVHGFASCLREFGDLPERLADEGIAALAIDLRGHGVSAGERGRIGLGRTVADVDAAALWLRERLPKASIGLVGHSLGGALALGVAARRDGFDALVVAHPVDRLFDEVPRWQRAGYHVAGRIGKRRMAKGRSPGSVRAQVDYRDLFVDPEAARLARRDPFLQERRNIANYTFAVTMKATQWARNVHVPVLCIGSEHDRFVDPRRSQDVFDAIAGPVQAVRHRGGHSCFLDLDGPLIADETVAFLQARLGGK